ncbi:equilibrative nucleobase transporter 1-like [Heterodontus francisci]|uniref:equilibrative nucleobase transporter 1-like n=1 Tax=Heterodontus francisci TaxID=7792 RepID=UPI00355C42E6
MESLYKRVKRYLTFATGLFECIGFAGVVFGWASLVFVLKIEEYFSDLCVPLHNASDPGVRNGTVGCKLQDERLALVFTLASFAFNVSAFASGILFDYLGTTVTRVLAISLYTTGMLMIAFSTAASAGILFPALLLIAVGGISLLITNIQVGNLFGTKRSTVITLYNGAVGSSSAVFLLVKILYEAGLSLMSMFLFISSLSSIQILRTIFLLPRTHIPYPLPEGYTYGVSCEKIALEAFSLEDVTASQRQSHHGGDATEGEEELRRAKMEGDRGERLEMAEGNRDEEQEGTEMSDGVNPQPNGTEDSENIEEEIPSFRSCIFSKIFLTHLLWFSVMLLRHYLFIGTLNPMLNLLASGDSEQVSRITNAFAFIQLFAIFCAPWNGLLMDWQKRRNKPADVVSGNPGVISQLPPSRSAAPSQRLADMKLVVLSLAITVTLGVLFSICAAIPVLQVQYLTFVLQLFNTAFMFGGYTTFIAITFPPCHFGKIYGLGRAITAFVTLLQYPCFALVQGPLQDNPLYLNIGFIVLVSLTYVHPINVYLHCRWQTQQRGAVTPSRDALPGLGQQDNQPERSLQVIQKATTHKHNSKNVIVTDARLRNALCTS